MNGKYFMIENKQQEELLYTIADFLWNNGNEVIVQDNFCDDDYYQHFFSKNPCIITVDENDFSTTGNWINKVEQGNNTIIIRFSATGVYTNVIPYPHRIFHFDILNQSELNRFFDWCIKLNLFGNQSSKQNIFLPNKHTK